MPIPRISEKALLYEAVIKHLVAERFTRKPQLIVIDPPVKEIPELDWLMSSVSIRVFDPKQGRQFVRRYALKSAPTIHLEVSEVRLPFAVVYAGFPFFSVSGNTDRYYLRKRRGRWTVERKEQWEIAAIPEAHARAWLNVSRDEALSAGFDLPDCPDREKPERTFQVGCSPVHGRSAVISLRGLTVCRENQPQPVCDDTRRHTCGRLHSFPHTWSMTT
jgi:hypothetical protein